MKLTDLENMRTDPEYGSSASMSLGKDLYSPHL